MTRRRAQGSPPPRPTKEQLLAAYGRKVPDLIAPGLSVLFCGINPGLYSGATGLHFAKPGNRFWPVLFTSGFTDRLLFPWESHLLLEAGYGITAIVRRTTATEAELSREEFVAGRRALERKVAKYKPRWVALVGIGAYRKAFDRPLATVGKQPERIGPAGLWVVPNPSGLNANHQMPELTEMFRALRRAAEHTR